MRVLVLSHNRSDSEDAYNHRLRELRRALERAGVDASIAYLGDPPLGKPTMLHPLKIGRVPGVAEADTIHAGSAAVAFACAFLPGRRRKRIVFDMHGDTVAEARLQVKGPDPAGRLRVFQERVKQRIGLRVSDRVLVVSDSLRDHVLGLGMPAERVTIVRNGVDLARFRCEGPAPCREQPLVTYAGRFDAWQGVENLLRLASRSGDGFRLRIAGFTEADRAVEARFRSLSSGRAELIGMLDREALVASLAESDLLLIPRESNDVTDVAMPTKFAEYLAVGRPILLTRVGEPAVLVERHGCGIVVDGGGEALFDGVRRFAALPPEERRAMGARARALAEREFSWEAIGAGYAAFLRALHEARGTG